MSYVLEALRKSEQERQIAAGASTGVLHPVVVDQRVASWRWPIVAIFAAAVVLALAWQFWPRPHLAVAARPVTPAQSVAIGLREGAATQPHIAAAPVTAPTPQSDRTKSVLLGRPALPVADARRAADAKGSTSAAPTADQAPLVAADLPAALQKELPPLVIAGFIHDEQGGSMAMVDDKLLREGEEVAPGLRLEKILGDGALFSYKGYRFRR